nr:ATP-binding protein [Burkholderia gladioli]
MSNVTYKFSGRHGSIQNLIWSDVPPFCVVTGENGAGKTHLLESLVHGHGSSIPDGNPHRPGIKPISIKLEIEAPPEVKRRTVYYAPAVWMPPQIHAVSHENIVSHAKKLYDFPTRNNQDSWSDKPLYEGWSISEDSVLGIVGQREAMNRPSWDIFESRLTPADFTSDVLAGNIMAEFVAYVLLKAAAKDRISRLGGNIENEIHRLGEPPWLAFNRYCEEAGLNFEVQEPEYWEPRVFGSSAPSYQCFLRDTVRDISLPISEISSGEKAMLALIMWRYFAERHGTRYDLFVMDEPDAHLHPSLVRKFMQVLDTTMVKNYGARVVISTHSPSTVALAPPGSVFELRRHEEPRIIARPDVAKVVAALTEGLVAVDSATKFVVLEGKTDTPFYQNLWTLMVEAGLPSFPGVAFFNRDGCSKVVDTVRFLREWDFSRFFGILDKDSDGNENRPEDGIFVVDRNGMENYLFDPLNIWLCLWKFRPEIHEKKLLQIDNFRRGSGSTLKFRKSAELQAIVDSVWEAVKSSALSNSKPDEEKVSVSFVGGLSLQYPRWFVARDDHSLAADVRKTFHPYPIHETNLRESFMELNLISNDLWRIFSEIVK